MSIQNKNILFQGFGVTLTRLMILACMKITIKPLYTQKTMNEHNKGTEGKQRNFNYKIIWEVTRSRYVS